MKLSKENGQTGSDDADRNGGARKKCNKKMCTKLQQMHKTYFMDAALHLLNL